MLLLWLCSATVLAAPTRAEDLDAIKSRGVLRILVPANIDGSRFLPRKGSPVAGQEQAAEAFARSQGLEPQIIPVRRFADMIPELVAGHGDIIAANLTVNDQRRKKIAFSLPVAQIREQVLVRADDDSIKDTSDLDGKRVMAERGSTFWTALEWLRENKYPGIKLIERLDHVYDEDVLDLLVRGEIDATVRDSNVADMYLGYRDDIKVAYNFSDKRNIAWGLPRDAPRLRAALDRFLQLEHMTDPVDPVRTGDLDAIRKNRVIRVLLRNNAASYFLYRGELVGFEYELAKAFARHIGVRLEVIVPPDHQEMLGWLIEGRADMAASFLEPDPDWRAAGIAYSKPYHDAPRHVVARTDDPLADATGLHGRSISAQRSTTYWDDAVALASTHGGSPVHSADEALETEDLIEMVADGSSELTIADEHLLELEQSQGVAVKSAFSFGEKRTHAVAVRSTNPKLLKAVNAFIAEHRKGLLYNVLYKKYFENKKSIRKLADGRETAEQAATLSPYDQLTKRYAERYGFDWRLVTAQIYQESRFDPDAKSFAGARGLMQIMPRTAKGLGFDEVSSPEKGIHAGIKYLDWLRDRFDEEIPLSERNWFVLAAYNAGSGHVADARHLAGEQGLDPNRWFANVEQAMLLLSKKTYAAKARHGYVRGNEPVNYVRDIRERFQAYIALTDAALAWGGATQ